jgi:hypothetical protein
MSSAAAERRENTAKMGTEEKRISPLIDRAKQIHELEKKGLSLDLNLLMNPLINRTYHPVVVRDRITR